MKTEKLLLWGLFFNDQEFVLDKEDLVAIDDILKTVLEGMGDPEVVVSPLLNREKVMSSEQKRPFFDL